MKLNLGCHDRPKEGYTNVDMDQYPGVDLVCDVAKLPIGNEVADELYASNVLEHFPHTQTVEVLKEWARVLKPGAILKISVPDFDRTIEIYNNVGLADWVVNFLWGDQGYKGAFHYCAFNEDRLTKLLTEAGFSEISRVEDLPGACPNECSRNRSNLDGKPVCLNLVVVK
jgi:ubiquinone/menaquinone biosynthesis C-methylase UbiE